MTDRRSRKRTDCSGTVNWSSIDNDVLFHLLSAKLGGDVKRVTYRKQSSQSSAGWVERLELQGKHKATPRSAVVKVVARQRTQPDWPVAAEGLLHAALLSCGAPLPNLYWHGEIRLSVGKCGALVLEDPAPPNARALDAPYPPCYHVLV